MNSFHIKGFTLVEVLLTSSILLVFSGMAFQFFISQHKEYERSQQITEVQDRVRTVIDLLALDIQSAGSRGVPIKQADPIVNPFTGTDGINNADQFAVCYFDPYDTSNPAVLTNSSYGILNDPVTSVPTLYRQNVIRTANSNCKATPDVTDTTKRLPLASGIMAMNIRYLCNVLTDSSVPCETLTPAQKSVSIRIKLLGRSLGFIRDYTDTNLNYSLAIKSGEAAQSITTVTGYYYYMLEKSITR